MFPSPPSPSSNNTSGFSLVELSIVLVILGLLTGGILTGQSLIRAAELRSISTEFDQFQTAVQTFKGKYFARPGDMTNATAFWGAAHATPATCLTTVGTGTQTCNGDGDGIMDGAATAGAYGENYTFWQHLMNAGLLEGNYTGRAGSGGVGAHILGTNAPTSKLSSGGWTVGYGGNHPGNASTYTLNYGNMITIGASMTNNAPFNPLLSPEEAWNVDTKMDDGKPAQGKVVSHYWNNACAAADDGSSAMNDLVASYRVSDSTTQCTLIFREAF